MATPFRPYGPVLTRGTAVFDLRTLLYRCPDWSGLERAPGKRGGDRTVPQQRGAARRPRYAGALSGGLPVTINGRFTDSSVPAAGGPSDWYANMLAAKDLLLTFLDDDDPVEVMLYRPAAVGNLAGLIQVEDPAVRLTMSGHECRLVVEWTHADGALQVAP
jgi:hypothetical protein